MTFHAPKWYLDEIDELWAPEPVPVRPRWWYTTDGPTLARITFLPDYEPQDGNMVVVGMRASWESGEMPLCCETRTGLYFRKVRDYHTAEYGKVFAPAPPPVGIWSGELPQ